MMKIESKYMQRAIQLAQSTRYSVAPNPMVGAVIVYNDRIIGEGYHAKCGEAHAEVNAVNSVREPELLKRSTMYVTLEPCSHYGKTPPCSKLIIDKQIPRVVVGCVDPFPEVAGRGIRMLREAGVEVEVGVLEQACLDLNRRFITFHQQRRPYILLKWAESADGFMDIKRTSCKTPVRVISTPMTQQFVHKNRSEVNAIMVGTHTALLDNPSLSVRSWSGKDPLRIVFDRKGELPADFHLLDDSIPTWVLTDQKKQDTANTRYLKYCDLSHLMELLYQASIQSLMVEGGALLLHSFIEQGLWDEAYVEHGTDYFKEGIVAPILDKAFYQETLVVDEHLITRSMR